MKEAEIFSGIMTAVTPLIQSIVEVLITPKLETFRDKDKSKKLPTKKNFTEYFHRTFKKLAVVNTLVFHNSQRLLNDIYIPLTISQTNDNVMIKTTINNYPQQLSDEFHNILITDTAGMGKSTMMKKIFISAIYENCGIPLFIELRRLKKSKKLIDEIQEQLSPFEKNFDRQLLLELLAQGGFIIILDGYDEITLSDRVTVTEDIQNFISKASNNHFFMTSRPENALSCFGDFQEFRIDALAKNEAFALLHKYDNQGEISSLLIEKLQEDDMKNIDEFLTNPLLVSLLFTAFEYKQLIPLKKYLFYRQVFDAFFDAHDLTKGDSFIHDKYSKLSIDDFHRVLRHIGYNCLKQQKNEFSKDETLKLIEQSKKFCIGLSFNESDFLTDLLKTVPLFTQDGIYYRWAHKSLQEYFAAQFIYMDSKEKQNDILLGIYNHSQLEKFTNILDLYYDMDYKTFRNVIEYCLLKDYCKKYASTSISYKKHQRVSDEEFIKQFCSITHNRIILEILYRKKDNMVKQELETPKNIKTKVTNTNNAHPMSNHFRPVVFRMELPDMKKIRGIETFIEDFNYMNLNLKLKRNSIEVNIGDYFFRNHNAAMKRYKDIKASVEAEKNDDLLMGFSDNW